MYERIGTYDGELQPLIDLSQRLRLLVNKRGYATSYMDQQRGIALYQPVLGEVFRGEWSFALVSTIRSEGHIHLHTDVEPRRDDSQRFHLVLKNNPACWSYSADAGWQQLEEGGIYSFDPSIEHAAINLGSEDRLHFVVDVRR